MNLLPDITVIYMWPIFMASLFVLNHFVFKPTLEILKERRKQTVGSQKEIEYFQEQTDIKFKEYESLMSDAKKLARIARDEILKEADVHQKEVVGKAREEAEHFMQSVKTSIKDETVKARTSLKGQTESLAGEIASKLIERKVA